MYRVKSKEEIISEANRKSKINGFVFESNSMGKALVFADQMFEYCGKECEIVPLNQVKKIKPYYGNETNYYVNNWYHVDIDDMRWWWRIDWLEEINDEEISDINIEELI